MIEKQLYRYVPLTLCIYSVQFTFPQYFNENLDGFHESTGQSFIIECPTAISSHRALSQYGNS